MSHSESGSELLLELAEEFLDRCRKGERPSLKEYIDRHPELAGEIREVFPAMAMMENIAVVDDSIEVGANRGLSKSAEIAVRQLGDYRIIREIGHGGMGVVYEAEQVSLGRHVALKLLPNHALHDAKHKRRFEREAKAAAKLHHTNIVPVFGVGEHDGVPYYVMQFIQGLGLDAVLDELNHLQIGAAPTPTGLPTAGEIRVSRRDVSAADVARSLMTGTFQETSDLNEEGDPKSHAPLDATLDQIAGNGVPDEVPRRPKSDFGRLSDSLTVSSSSISLPGSSGSGHKSTSKKQTYWQSVANIGKQVAEALEYAHKQGVQHRDVKPSNLLLDLRGTAWVTDFGLAKVENPDAEDLTHTGDLLGTLRYMPPEAFEGKSDVRGDVYSLGLTLYEMLAMRPAFDEKDRNKLVKQVTSGDPTPLDKVRREIPRDLVTIVQKAIAREPSRRYATAEELATDLQRFLDDEPIQARRQTTLERCIRWSRHNPGIATLGGALAVVLVLVTVASLVAAGYFNRLRANETLAAQNERVARREATAASNAAAMQAAGLLLDKGIEDARGGEPGRALHLFVSALRTLPADDRQTATLERVIRANLSAWSETVPALEHIWQGGSQFSDVVYTHDGEMIAMAVGPDEVECRRTDTFRPVGPRLKIPNGFQMGAKMAFAPDGKSLWVSSTGRDVVAKQWGIHRFDPVSGRSIPPMIPSDGPVMSFIVTPDGQHLIGPVWGLHPENRGGVADSSRTQLWRTESILVWEAATGRVVRKVEVNAERERATATVSPDTYLSLTPDGKGVTAWCQRGTNRFEGMTFQVLGNEAPHRVTLPTVASEAPWKLHFQHDMRTGLAIKDDQVHRWSAAEPGVLGPGVPTPFRAMLYAPSADGRSVISQLDGRVFDTGAWPPRPSFVRFAHPGWQRSPNAWAEQSPDGRFTATWDANIPGGGGDGRHWRLPRPHSRSALSPAELTRQPERNLDYQFASFDPSGTIAVLWSHDRGGSVQASDHRKNVRVVDATTCAVREPSVRHSAVVRDVAFSPDGRYFATGSFDATARVWETATGRPAGPVLQHSNYVATVAFSPDGGTLAAGDYGPRGLVKFWDWRSGKESRPPLQLDDIVLNVSFSQDGRYLAAAKSHDWSGNPELLLWDLASGSAVFRKHFQCPGYLLRESTRFRPDSRAFAIRDANGVLRLWEIPSGKLIGERPLDGDGVTRFSPDGRVIAAASNLGVRLFDADTLAPLPGGFLFNSDRITDVAFSPDGTLLLVGYESGSAQLWEVAARKPVGPPAVLIGAIRAVSFTPDGKSCVCVAGDGTLRRWQVPTPFAEPDLARLAERVALMTGLRMDDNQALGAVPVSEWIELRSKLVADGSTALVPPCSDADWHDAVAADAEQDGDALGAEWHLERLAKLRPNDWTIPARRGRILAAAGRKEESQAAYMEARRLAPSAQVLADWLRCAAGDDNAADRKEIALANLKLAMSLTPNDWTLYALRSGMDPVHADADFDEAIRRGAEPGVVERVAVRAAEMGNWKRSAALFNGLSRDPTFSAEDRYVLAIAKLKAGDLAGYRAACAGIAKKLPPVGKELNVLEAYFSAKAFSVGPNATDDWTKPIAWIDHSLTRLQAFEKANPDKKDALRREKHMFLSTRGAVLVRAGRFQDAPKALREGMNVHPDGGEFSDWAFLALTEHRLGNADSAKTSAAKARTIQSASMPRSVWDKAELELLAMELDAAMPRSGK